jgi:hypothetical protein
MRARNRIPFDRHPLAMLLGAIVVVGYSPPSSLSGQAGCSTFSLASCCQWR